MFANESLVYIVLNNQRWGTTGVTKPIYLGLYSYNFTTGNIEELYIESFGDYDFCLLGQINIQFVNGKLYIEYITNVSNGVADFYIQRFDGEWHPLLVKEQGIYVGCLTNYYVSQDFNLLKMYSYYTDFRTASWNLLDITEIYSASNYNGEPYENYNSLIGDYGNIYSNNKLVFSRDLYNLSVINNYSVSTLEIPNTYLNGITLSPKDLIGKTNTK